MYVRTYVEIFYICYSVVAELRVMRTGGAFGEVTIPYEVVPVSPDGATTSDLLPNRGTLFFSPNDRFSVSKTFSYSF